MASIDSAAVFRSRALSFGLLASDVDALNARGWSSMSSFAFSTSSIPGQAADDVAFRRDLVVPILGTENHIRATLLRRLYFEAYTLTASDLRTIELSLEVMMAQERCREKKGRAG